MKKKATKTKPEITKKPVKAKSETKKRTDELKGKMSDLYKSKKVKDKQFIKAPFNKDQVKQLNEYQESGMFHPFTCPKDGNAAHIKYEFEKEHHGESFVQYVKKQKEKGVPYPEAVFNQTNLVATDKGWICPVCGYTQDWAHTFMADKKVKEEFNKKFKNIGEESTDTTTGI